ncbi:MFS transporter, partial [Klebsiella pneumoniae]|nr:MFS transporter [Klebsiella pneumoniae]
LTTVGWRIPFVASFALVAVGLWIRASVPETPDFAQESEQRRTKAFPLIALLRQDWRGLAVVIGIALGCTSISYIF